LVSQITDFQMQPTQFSINIQIFYRHICLFFFHSFIPKPYLLFLFFPHTFLLKPETRNLTPYLCLIGTQFSAARVRTSLTTDSPRPRTILWIGWSMWEKNCFHPLHR